MKFITSFLMATMLLMPAVTMAKKEVHAQGNFWCQIGAEDTIYFGGLNMQGSSSASLWGGGYNQEVFSVTKSYEISADRKNFKILLGSPESSAQLELEGHSNQSLDVISNDRWGTFDAKIIISGSKYIGNFNRSLLCFQKS